MESKPSKLGAFLRKHHTIVTFVGAFVVFLTFVVKEGLGEKWQHLAESIDNAEYIHSIRADISHNDLTGLQILATLEDKDRKGDRQSTEEYAIRMLSTELSRLRSSLGMSESLMEKLPDAEVKRERFRLLTEGLTGAQGKADAVFILSWRLPFPPGNKFNPEGTTQLGWSYGLERRPPKAADWQDSSDPVEKETTDLLDSVSYLKSDIEKFIDDVLQQARDVRRQNEKRSQYARWISGALFGIGWGLGLLGKIYGVASVGE